MPCDKSPKFHFDSTPVGFTDRGGLSIIGRLAHFLRLPQRLARKLRIKVRKRGCTDLQMILSLVYSMCSGGQCLADVDGLGGDATARQLTGLRAVPDSRRLGEYLKRFTQGGLDALRDCVRQLSASLVPDVVRHSLRTQGYVPVFMDGTAIEVTGKKFEGAKVGFNGKRQFRLHAIFVGGAWAGGWLNRGATDVRGDWRKQLELDLKPLLKGVQNVWIRMDAAYYCGKLVQYVHEQGWHYTVSVTDSRKKAPILCKLRKMKLKDKDWVWLDDEGLERAHMVFCKPRGWWRKEAYVVIRRDRDGDQLLLKPFHTIIPVSKVEMSLKELVRRHRSKQGHENAFKGPLTDLGLHHPPCRNYMANQAYYLCAQLAQLLLRIAQYWTLPKEARRHGLRPLIRDLVRSVARLVRSGRQWRVQFASCNRRQLDWLVPAGRRLEPNSC